MTPKTYWNMNVWWQNLHLKQASLLKMLWESWHQHMPPWSKWLDFVNDLNRKEGQIAYVTQSERSLQPVLPKPSTQLSFMPLKVFIGMILELHCIHLSSTSHHKETVLYPVVSAFRWSNNSAKVNFFPLIIKSHQLCVKIKRKREGTNCISPQ